MKNMIWISFLMCAGCYGYGDYKPGASCVQLTQHVGAVENRTGGAVNIDMNYWAINPDKSQTKKTVTVILNDQQVFRDVLGPAFPETKVGSYDREGYAINAYCSATPANKQADLRLTTTSMLAVKACVLETLSWVILIPLNQACPAFSAEQTQLL